MLGNPGRISPRMIRLGLRGIAPPSANRPGCSASAQAAPAPHPLRDFALDGTPGSAEASDKGAPPPGGSDEFAPKRGRSEQPAAALGAGGGPRLAPDLHRSAGHKGSLELEDSPMRRSDTSTHLASHR